MGLRIITTGHRGYLLTNLLPEMNIINSRRYHKNYTFSNTDMILHFASPSDSEGFKDENRLYNANITLTTELIELAKKLNCKLVFASTMGVHNPNNLYCILKLQAEELIKNNLKDYLIIRIPRVYSKDRDKGLIKDIKNNVIPEEDYNKIIQFADLRDFKEFFDNILHYRGVIDYNGTLQELSIKQIKEKYEL